MKVDLIAGARPNFMKISPIIDAIKNYKSEDISYRLIHTGQHYDYSMSGSFFDELGIPQPDLNLGVGGTTQAEQTAEIMIKYERILARDPCDLCIVVGDVTSTMSCAISAKKMNILVAHVESGIRANDKTMPEEINRLVTDSISDLFFTTSQSATINLMNEGHNSKDIFFVGNTMIDTLVKQMPKLKKPNLFDENKLAAKKYFILTLHRPSNVDNPTLLQEYLQNVIEGASGIPIIFPVHPRTKKNLLQNNCSTKGLILTDPLSYLEFNYLVYNSLGVVTDSGGITEETTFMGIPCITLRNNTERPETCLLGTNELIGTDPLVIPMYLNKIIKGTWKKGAIPELWDGNTSKRIIDVLINYKL